MNYYLVNYEMNSKNGRIAIPSGAVADIDTLKQQIALIKNAAPFEVVEIKDFKEVTEDVFNLISPFINCNPQEDESVNG